MNDKHLRDSGSDLFRLFVETVEDYAIFAMDFIVRFPLEVTASDLAREVSRESSR
jgi:hypothetical protein